MWHRCQSVRISISVCVPSEEVPVGMCSFLFLFRDSRGAQEAHRAVPNETLYGDLRICSLISCTYLLFELLNEL